MPVGRKNRHALIATMGGAFSVFLGVCSAAQEGQYGVGHAKWHHEFYSMLKRKDGATCCSDYDCRPTRSRTIGDHYDVKVDGNWTAVERDTIIDVVAPDGGAHVCAPKQIDELMGVLFCVILPPDS
jgi:hypothetical protein